MTLNDESEYLPYVLGRLFAVLEAVQNGTITQERLDQSVNKILRYKEVFAHV